MTARRRLTAAVSAGFALFVLTGCEKPAPIVTVVSGGQSEWAEANTFCFEGQSWGDNCAERKEGVTDLPVRPGEQVSIDVSKEVAERGWRIVEFGGGADGPPAPVFEEDHYFSFTAPNIGQPGAMLTIQTLDESRQQPTGEWQFRLVPKE